MSHDPAKTARIDFEPAGVEVQTIPGESILDSARRAKVRIASACGGRGICKSCIIHFTGGDIPPPSANDRDFFSSSKLGRGWRRACQCSAIGDSRIHVPARARAESARMQVDGSEFWVQPEPLVEICTIELTRPSLAYPKADFDRLVDRLTMEKGSREWTIDPETLRSLPATLRRNHWLVQVVIFENEIIAIQPTQTRLVGLAVDLGTTNIGIFLVDLHSGNTIASTGIENPQGIYGSDVISRIGTAAQHPEKATEMHRLVVDAINQAATSMCEAHQLATDQIVDIVVAGNTAMHHLFTRLPVRGLGLAPFTPVITRAMDFKAREICLKSAPGARIHMIPNIAGFVGGDHTAMLIGISAHTESRTIVALDIGTNTEISLLHQGTITSLSCPSGPALEGGHISCGMRASTGAIEAISIAGDSLRIKTIGDTDPIGLCGSAVVDATAAFFLAGGLNHRGKIARDYRHTVLQDGEPVFMLHQGEPAVVFTQRDVRSVQLAKGSIRAGIELLLEHAGLKYDQLERIVVAGAFGNYINIESACTIGLFPRLPLENFEQIGNAAGTGAKLILLSKTLRRTACELAARSTHLVQAGNPSFNAHFMHNIHFHQIN